MTVEIISRKRLLHPCKVEGLKRVSATDRLVHGEGLIAIDHKLKLIAESFADSCDAANIFFDRLLTDLDLHAVKTIAARDLRSLDQFFCR